MLIVAAIALLVVGLAGVYLMTQATPARESPASAATREPRGHGLAALLERRGDVLQGLMDRDVPLGTVLCGTDVLGRASHGRKVYVWLECGDYATGGGATELGSGAEAAVVTVAGHGPNRSITRVEIPSPSRRDRDLRRMFPRAVRGEVYAGAFAAVPDAAQRLRIARRL